MDFEKKVVELDVNDILPNRFQPRIKFNEDSINELCDSIREHGVIQPIVVRKMGDKFEIIAGERRFKASLLAGKMTIPAVVTELNDKDSAEVALIENVQRRDLTPIEEAISYKKILDMGYLTQEDLAIKLGKTQSTVANKLRLLNLTEDVQEALLEEKISERHARSLLKLTNPAQQREMLENIITNRLTVRKTDDAIAKVLKGDSVQEENLNDKVDNISNLNTFNSNLSVNNVSTPDLNDTFNPFTSDISYNNIQNNNNDNYNNQITNNNVNDYKETTLNSNFEDSCYILSDTGAIYTGRDVFARGNLIKNCNIYGLNSYNNRDNARSGIYLDDMASSTTIDSCMVDGYRHGVQLGGGRYNTIINCTIKNSIAPIWADARGMGWMGNSGKVGQAYNAMKYLNGCWKKETWVSKYPHINDIPLQINDFSVNSEWAKPRGNIIKNNIFENYSYKYGVNENVKKLGVYEGNSF